MAPKAYIGSYKVFGSEGVNDHPSDAAIMSALEDAFYDGMDIVNLSLGSTAITGPISMQTSDIQLTGTSKDYALESRERLDR